MEEDTEMDTEIVQKTRRWRDGGGSVHERMDSGTDGAGKGVQWPV